MLYLVLATNLPVSLEVDGDIKRSRKGRYKAGGPVLNVVFSNGIRAGDVDSTLNDVIFHFSYSTHLIETSQIVSSF